MSADNYIAVGQGSDDRWYVWMVGGGYDDEDWSVERNKDRAVVFDDKLAALEHAHWRCTQEIVEYGVSLLPSV